MRLIWALLLMLAPLTVQCLKGQTADKPDCKFTYTDVDFATVMQGLAEIANLKLTPPPTSTRISFELAHVTPFQCMQALAASQGYKLIVHGQVCQLQYRKEPSSSPLTQAEKQRLAQGQKSIITYKDADFIAVACALAATADINFIAPTGNQHLVTFTKTNLTAFQCLQQLAGSQGYQLVYDTYAWQLRKSQDGSIVNTTQDKAGMPVLLMSQKPLLR